MGNDHEMKKELKASRQQVDDGAVAATGPVDRPSIPAKTLARWQGIVDLVARVLDVPAALIMKVDAPQIEVFVSSSIEGNPYVKGQRADLNSGLYCETVMSQGASLLVPNALKESDWDHNPEIELGLISYLGFPLRWPDGDIFGTICVLDRKENHYSATYKELLEQFKEVIEADMKMFLGIVKCGRMANALREARDDLERQVKERTAELEKANEQLRMQMVQQESAQEALRQSMQWLAEAQRVAKLGNWNWDIAGNELYWSDEVYRIFGLLPQEFEATYAAFLAFVHPDDRQSVEEAVNDALADPDAIYDIEHRMVRPDGTECVVRERGKVIFDRTGKAIRMVGTVQDITDLKQKEQEKDELQAQYLRSQELTIFALAKLAESRDSETGAHLERVQSYTRVLAEDLAGLPKFMDRIDPEFLRLIYLTSPLHDIGKVSIPDCVLLKPGRLDKREFEIMKTHAAEGARTLRAALRQHPEARFLQMALDIAASHHERFDGTGYPAELSGESIPLCARIFSVADVYDALVSKRVYKEAFSDLVSRDIILQGRGEQFDPDVVDAFGRSESQLLEIRQQYARPLPLELVAAGR